MIRLVDDVGAPLLVTLADTLTVDKKPGWNRPLGIGIMVAGYGLGGVMGMGPGRGEFLKQMGVASFAWGVQSIYQYVKGGGASRVYAGAKTRVARRVSRYPGDSYASSGFGGLKLE